MCDDSKRQFNYLFHYHIDFDANGLSHRGAEINSRNIDIDCLRVNHHLFERAQIYSRMLIGM